MFFVCLFFDSSTLDALLARRENQKGETDRGDKSFSCGHPVWGLAFGPRPPRSAAACPSKWKPPKGNNSLLLATGLENGVIKIWNVLTGKILAGAVFAVLLSAPSFHTSSCICFSGDAVFDLHGHEGVVRDLVFPQNGTLTLISSSRDKTLRIWDLAQKGQSILMTSSRLVYTCCCDCGHNQPSVYLMTM